MNGDSILFSNDGEVRVDFRAILNGLISSSEIIVPRSRNIIQYLILYGTRFNVGMVLRAIIMTIRVVQYSVRWCNSVHARIVRVIRLREARFSSVVIVVVFNCLRDGTLTGITYRACVRAYALRGVMGRKDNNYFSIEANSAGRFNVDVTSNGLGF